MQRYTWGKFLLASPWLALPLLAVPALCFTINRVSFLWSVIILALTGWKLRKPGNSVMMPDTAAKAVLMKLGMITFLLQMLAFAWIGTFWMLQGLARLVMQSPGLSRIVGWIQAQWFAEAAAWLILFAVVCGLFRLTRPIFLWHQRAVQNAALLLRKGDMSDA